MYEKEIEIRGKILKLHYLCDEIIEDKMKTEKEKVENIKKIKEKIELYYLVLNKEI